MLAPIINDTWPGGFHFSTLPRFLRRRPHVLLVWMVPDTRNPDPRHPLNWWVVWDDSVRTIFKRAFWNTKEINPASEILNFAISETLRFLEGFNNHKWHLKHKRFPRHFGAANSRLYPPAMPDCVRHLCSSSASICPSFWKKKKKNRKRIYRSDLYLPVLCLHSAFSIPLIIKKMNIITHETLNRCLSKVGILFLHSTSPNNKLQKERKLFKVLPQMDN